MMNGLTLTDARDTLNSVTYKPGYRLMWGRPTSDRYVLSIWWEYDVPDCNEPHVVRVGKSGSILVDLADTSKEGLLRQVFGMTLRLEEHEAREWFAYQNHRMFDPHRSLLDERERYSHQMGVEV